jgi:sRNA-binding carbon storage regulator CsrA
MGRPVKGATVKEGDQILIGDSVVQIVSVGSNGRVKMKIASPEEITIKGAGIVRAEFAERAENLQLATT